MNSLVADSELTIRLGVFALVFICLTVLELLYPRRTSTYSRSRRWLTNLGMSVFNTLCVRLLLPLAGVGAALLAQQQGWGIFNAVILPTWCNILLFLLLFDFAIYWQHRLFHWLPWLWRLHRMHHTDPDYDLTTGNRFHPLSILLSALIKIGLVLLLGPVPVAVVVAEVLLNATSMFNHSNIKIPERIDALLRLFVVTPDVHRVHHSVDAAEHNSNFGFNFPWWDRLFATYSPQPQRGHEHLQIGISGFEDARATEFLNSLVQPLHR